MTVIERVAKAMCRQAFGGMFSVDSAVEKDWQRWVPYARAAIAAMREPTEAMKEAGDQFTHCGGPCGNRAGREAWRAMIDAALAETLSPPADDTTPIGPKRLPSFSRSYGNER